MKQRHKKTLLGGLVFACLLSAVPAQRMRASAQAAPGDGQPNCTAVAALKLPDVRITEAVPTAEGQTAEGQTIKVPHCKVSGVIGREIRFVVLLPDVWNRGFFMGGGGGFVGNVDNQAQASINLGYATAGTDTGHQGVLFQAGWALNDLERQLNFGYLAIHRTTEIAKAIIRSHYGADAAHSYFLGCSNGGRQAMMEAQRYPDDFDGIVSGAPAMDFAGLAAQFVKDMQVAFPNPADLSKPILTPEKLALVESKILASCDGLDGVKDGVMEDPRMCAFDTASIPTCAGDPPGSDCLTKAQHAALKGLYAAPQNKDGAIYSAQPFGGEGQTGGWTTWMTGINQQIYGSAKLPSLRFAFGGDFFKYFVFSDPAWDYTRYDFSNWKKDTSVAASLLNATNPDLGAFKAKGRKLVMYHGWSDAALTALASIKYFEQVEARDRSVRDYYRLFMEPGVLHCAGGTGPDRADWFTTIADWVERGKAPDHVVAAKMSGDGKPVRTRPLCPYPQKAVYTGTGSTDDAANFVCR